MSVLLKEIKSSSTKAASELEKAGFCTDSEIRSLTREDLHELFPGCHNLKLRKTIFGIIHKQKPIDVLLRQLKDFIPHESFKAALTSNGVLVDYLHTLKEMKTQMINVQDFLDGHIGLLEEFTKDQPQEPYKGSLADTGTSDQVMDTSQGHNQLMPCTGQTNPHGAHVMYQKVVSGKSFDADTQLLNKVKAQTPHWIQLIENNQDHKIIIVFCTISSRIGSDVEAAMFDVKGDKPVILVLMHHLREAKNIFPVRTGPAYPEVVLQVNVFFHETMHGLLKCPQNDEAASKIKNKLLELSGNALGVGGDGGVTGPAAGGDGGSSSSSFIFSLFSNRK